MRSLLKSDDLRRRFDVAWGCLPPGTQKDLRAFIRQVRQVKKLEGARIWCPDGTYFTVPQEGVAFAFFFKAGDLAFCDILLSALLCLEDEEDWAVATILHELAHAVEYMVEAEASIDDREIDSELSAWQQAATWVIQSGLAAEKISSIHGAIFAASIEVGALHFLTEG